MDLLQVLDKSYSNMAVHKGLQTITKLSFHSYHLKNVSIGLTDQTVFK